MSTVKNSDDELAGLKVSELKKLCKMNNLPTSGTKAELMGRILENKAIDSNFSALPPEEEARLLGDDDEESVGNTGGSQITTLTITGTTGGDDDDTTLDDLISVPTEGSRLLVSVVDSPALIKVTDSVGVGKTSIEEPIAATLLDDGDEDEEGPTMVKLRAISSASESDRLAFRANRFGLSRPSKPVGDNLSDEKLAARAKRFGLPIDNHSTVAGYTSPSKLSDVERLKQRAERFGVGANTSDSFRLATVDKADAERKALRLQRFSANNESTSKPMPKQAGQTSEEEERKSARAIKFGLNVAGIPSSVNKTANITDQETVLTKAAV